MDKFVWIAVDERSRGQCEECGRNFPMKHHAFGGANREKMEMVETVFDLCWEDHQGNKGVHFNRNKDLKYKQIATQNLLNLGWTKEQIIHEVGRWYLD